VWCVKKESGGLWKLASERLCQQIKTDGKNLGKGFLKVGREGGRDGGSEGDLSIYNNVLFIVSGMLLRVLTLLFPPSLPPSPPSLPQVNSFINHRVDVGLMDLFGNALH